MKYQNEAIGGAPELKEYLRGVINDLFANRLEVEGQTVELPDEDNLECKVKYSTDEDGSSVTLKISWDNSVEEETAD